MRIGYGFNRREEHFAHADCERLWLDFDRTDRVERAEMLVMGLRKGDTLVLLARGDLGRGAELPPIRQLLAERSVMVEICPSSSPPSRPVGAPPQFNPTSEQWDRIAAFWHDQRYSGPYARKRASEIMGFDVSRNMLNYKMGTRSDPKPKPDDLKGPS